MKPQPNKSDSLGSPKNGSGDLLNAASATAMHGGGATKQYLRRTPSGSFFHLLDARLWRGCMESLEVYSILGT